MLKITKLENGIKISNGIKSVIITKNDRWITVKPHGDEEKGRHLLLEGDESPKEAMKRQWGVDVDKKKKIDMLKTSKYKEKTLQQQKEIAEFKESEHPRDKEDVKKLNIKDVKILQETNHSYQIELPNGSSYWIKKSKVDKDGNLNVELDSQKTEKPTQKKVQEKPKEETEILTYPKENPNGYELKVDEKDKKYIAELAEKSDMYGKNLREGKDFDKFAEEWQRKELLSKVDDMTFEELSGYAASNVEELNELIEDDEDNDFGRTEPFANEAEARKFLENRYRENIDGMIDTNNLTESEWDKIREAYEDRSGRKDFFYDYGEVISQIMEKNGFYTTTDNSRISSSTYVDVYKSSKDIEEGIDAFAKIRISDHDTHRFYGHHINLYTTENVYKEINKLLRSFANADFGIKETVYNKAIEVL